MSGRKRVVKRTLIGGTAAAAGLIGSEKVGGPNLLDRGTPFEKIDSFIDDEFLPTKSGGPIADDLTDFITLFALTYLPAAGIFSTAEIVKNVKREFSKRRAIKSRITDVKSFVKGVRVTPNDVIRANQILKLTGSDITGKTFKNFSQGERLVYLRRLGKAPNQSVRAVLTAKEREFLRNIKTNTTLKDIRKLQKKGVSRAGIIGIQKISIRKKNKAIREMTYKSTRPSGPKQLTMGVSGKYPLALRPKPVGKLFNKILGTPEERRKIRLEQKHKQWLSTLSPKELKKYNKRVSKSAKKFASKVRRKKVLNVFRRF